MEKGIRIASIAVIAVLLMMLITGPTAAGNEGKSPVIVGFYGGADAAVVKAAGGSVTKVFNIIPAVAANMSPKAVQALQRNPKVEYIEQDRLLQAVYLPGETVPWGISQIDADDVAASGNFGWGVKVAVLDSGMDMNHPDLIGGYAGGYDFVDGDSQPDDECGHGTHVSGTLVSANNGAGIVGIAPDISLYALKFLDETGSGYTSDEIEGIEWAVANGIDILNMSYGSYYRSRSEQKALDAAYRRGMLLVAAAGNDNTVLKLYPAAYSSVISVAATDENNQRASFSNYNSTVELAGPGVDILSTMPTYYVYLNSYGYSQDYDCLNGTSMATPHVAGAAALVMSQNPSWANTQVRERLAATAIDLGDPGRDSEYGYGLVNALAACSTPEPPVPGDVGSISGVVYMNGVVVSGATVNLIDQNGSKIASMKTNSSGEYAFSDVSADNDPLTYYIVSAKFRNFKAASPAIDLTPGEEAVQNLNL